MSASRHAELLEQVLHLRVGLQVEPGERHAVLRQEVADPEGVLRIARADHAQAREVSRLAQKLPAGDERLQDEVAEVRVMVDELPQRVGRYLVDFAIAAGNGADERRSAGQLRHVAGELAGSLDGDGFRRVAGFVHDLDLAGLDDEELGVAVADFEESFPVPVVLEHRQRAACERCELGIGQFREGGRA